LQRCTFQKHQAVPSPLWLRSWNIPPEVPYHMGLGPWRT
jgi:hypothetical protein